MAILTTRNVTANLSKLARAGLAYEAMLSTEGHAAERHSQKSDAEMIDRMLPEHRDLYGAPTSVSSFTDEDTLRDAVNAVVRENAEAIATHVMDAASKGRWSDKKTFWANVPTIAPQPGVSIDPISNRIVAWESQRVGVILKPDNTLDADACLVTAKLDESQRQPSSRDLRDAIIHTNAWDRSSALGRAFLSERCQPNPAMRILFKDDEIHLIVQGKGPNCFDFHIAENQSKSIDSVLLELRNTVTKDSKYANVKLDDDKAFGSLEERLPGVANAIRRIVDVHDQEQMNLTQELIDQIQGNEVGSNDEAREADGPNLE